MKFLVWVVPYSVEQIPHFKEVVEAETILTHRLSISQNLFIAHNVRGVESNPHLRKLGLTEIRGDAIVCVYDDIFGIPQDVSEDLEEYLPSVLKESFGTWCHD